jgi:hypothetical protein
MTRGHSAWQTCVPCEHAGGAVTAQFKRKCNFVQMHSAAARTRQAGASVLRFQLHYQRPSPHRWVLMLPAMATVT